MKKIFVLLFFISVFISSSKAAYLKNIPQTLKQPNGETLHCFATGDEYYSWNHDVDGYTIVKNKKTGYWVYATLQNDILLPTSFFPNIHNPKLVGLTPWLNISKEKIHDIYVNSEMYLTLNRNQKKRPGIGKGLINNIVVFIKFNDNQKFEKTLSFFNTLYNDSTINSSSVYSYYKEVSHNDFTIKSTFYPKNNENANLLYYQDEYTREYYSPYDSISNPIGYQPEERSVRELQLLKNALLAIKDSIPENLNLDMDNNGFIDNVSFVIQGNPEGWSSLLWPHRWFDSNGIKIGSYTFKDYNFLIENHTDVGVLCHEFFHTLGAPDLYHASQDGIEPIGVWDIMANTTTTPQYMNSMSRYMFGGWNVDMNEINKSGVYTLNPVSSTKNNSYYYHIPNTTEYIIFEYRKKTGVFESNLPNSGLLIYRYNSSINGNFGGPPDGIFAYRPFGDSKTNGQLNNATFSKESGRTQMNINTDCKPYLSNDSLIHIDIYNVTEAKNTITFTIGITDSLAADFDLKNKHVCSNSSIQFTDKSIGSPISWNWNFPGGNPSTSNEQNPIVSYTNIGKYDVELTIKNSNGDEMKMVKKQYVSVDSYAINLPDTLIAQCGLMNSLTPEICNESNLNIQYTWTPSKGLSNPTILNPTFKITEDQSYILHAKYNSLTLSDTIYVRVEKPRIINLPDTVASMNEDSVLINIEPNISTKKYINSVNNQFKKINFSVGNFGLIVTNGCYKDPIKMEKDVNNQYNGCNSFPEDSFKNKTALINRGSCLFSNKAYNAQIAGATGVIIVDSVPNNPNFFSSFTGIDHINEIIIPVILINFENGALIKQLIESSNDVTITIGSDDDSLKVESEDVFETIQLNHYQFKSLPKKSKFLKFSISTVEGCRSVDSIFVKVKSKNYLNVEDISIENIEIYPNPARDYIIIKTENSENNHFEIYNYSGLKLFSDKIGNENQMVSTISWAKGLYLVKVINNMDVQIKTFVIE